MFDVHMFSMWWENMKSENNSFLLRKLRQKLWTSLVAKFHWATLRSSFTFLLMLMVCS